MCKKVEVTLGSIKELYKSENIECRSWRGYLPRVCVIVVIIRTVYCG